MDLKIYFSGDLYDQKCFLYYGKTLIYDGYVDSLITSQNEVLEIQLNFGTDRILPVTVKKIEDMFIWVPTTFSSNDLIKSYNTIVVSQKSMQNLWQNLRYELSQDLPYIHEVKINDLKHLWFVNSGLCLESENIMENEKKVKRSIVTFSYENSSFLTKVFHSLLTSDWDYTKIRKINNERLTYLIVYLDDIKKSIEWKAILKDSSGELLINLGNYWGLEVKID